MDLGYAVEKFSNAVNEAATSPKSIQQRLADAYIYDIVRVSEENVPPEIWARISKLTDAITCIPAQGDEGTVIATTSQMSEAEAVTHLKEIVTLKYKIVSAHEAAN